MEKKTWTVEIDGASRKVALEWTYWGGERQVSVDGEVIADDKKLLRWKSDQRFDLNGRSAVLRTLPADNMVQFDISLEVDGRVVEPDPGQKAFWEKGKDD